MSILVRFAPSAATSVEQYDDTIRRLEAEGEFPPQGLEYHCCFLVDGNLRVSEIWDSQAHFQAFGERLMPVLADVGIDPGQPEVFEVHNTIKGAPAVV
jgi:hypothetical protein